MSEDLKSFRKNNETRIILSKKLINDIERVNKEILRVQKELFL